MDCDELVGERGARGSSNVLSKDTSTPLATSINLKGLRFGLKDLS
jgi:hypothetical protein